MSDLPDLAAPMRDWLPYRMYPGHRPGLPDVVLGRLPEALARVRRTGMWKTWICETPRELLDVEHALAQPIPRGPRGELNFRGGPDGALGRGRGMPPAGEFVAALYQSPGPGWPVLVLTSSPVGGPELGLERGVYAWEALRDEDAALDHMERLAAMSAARGGARAVILMPPTLM